MCCQIKFERQGRGCLVGALVTLVVGKTNLDDGVGCLAIQMKCLGLLKGSKTNIQESLYFELDSTHCFDFLISLV